MNLQHLKSYELSDYSDYWVGLHKEIVHKQEVAIIKKLLPESSNWFADFGGGFGRLTPEYLNNGRSGLLIDYAINSLEQACERYPVVGLAADVSNLPLKDNSINGAIAVRLIQNSGVPEIVVREIYRTLCPGATVVLSYFNRRSLLRLLRLGPKCFKRVHVFEHLAKWGNMYGSHPIWFNDMAKKVGFKIGIQTGSGFTYQLTNQSKFLEKMVEKSNIFYKSTEFMGRWIDRVLGSLRLSLWQFVELKKDGEIPSQNLQKTDLLSILQCPQCKHPDLKEKSPSLLQCPSCKTEYPKKGNVINFRLEDTTNKRCY